MLKEIDVVSSDPVQLPYDWNPRFPWSRVECSKIRPLYERPLKVVDFLNSA